MQGSAEAELAYARLEALCQAVKVELQQDLHIHDAAVLPNFVNLPKIAAAEYGRVSTRASLKALALNNIDRARSHGLDCTRCMTGCAVTKAAGL